MQASEFQLNDIVTVTELKPIDGNPLVFKGVVNRVNKKTIALSNDKGVIMSIDPGSEFIKVSRKRGARP
jgi:hypothetical protein